MVYIGVPIFDEFDRECVQLTEIVAGEEFATVPIESEPLHIPADGVDILLAFLFLVMTMLLIYVQVQNLTVLLIVTKEKLYLKILKQVHVIIIRHGVLTIYQHFVSGLNRYDVHKMVFPSS